MAQIEVICIAARVLFVDRNQLSRVGVAIEKGGGDGRALQNTIGVSSFLEKVAELQACGAGPNDDCLKMLHAILQPYESI